MIEETKMTPNRMFSCDGITLDYKIPIANLSPALQAEVRQVIARKITNGGAKAEIATPEFDAFAQKIEAEGRMPKPVMGGSSLNTMRGLKGLMADTIEPILLTFFDRNKAGHLVAEAEKEGIKVINAADYKPDIVPHQARTLAFTDETGRNYKFTDRGNIQEFLTQSILEKAGITRDSFDMLFMQGSLRDKATPAFADRLMELHLGPEGSEPKPLYSANPTKAKLAKDQVDYFQQLNKTANRVLSNIEEHAGLYGANEEDIKRLDSEVNPFTESEANAFIHFHLQKLKSEFNKAGKLPYSQKGFITLGKRGVAIVTPDVDPHIIPSARLHKKQIVDGTGAGDGAIAGAIAADLMGMDDRDIAYLSSWMGAQTLAVNESVLKDPWRVIFTQHKMVAEGLYFRNEEMLNRVIGKHRLEQLLSPRAVIRASGLSPNRFE